MPPILTNFTQFPKDDFRDLMVNLYPEGYLFWAGDPEPFPGPVQGAPSNIIEMNVQRVRTLGTEDILKQDGPGLNGTTAKEITYSSHCVYLIRFNLTSFSYDFPAYDQLRKLCLRLRRQENTDALNLIGLAYARHFDIVDKSYIADERGLYNAEVEIEFNGLTVETDTVASGGIIETIGGWSGPAGSTSALPGTLTT